MAIQILSAQYGIPGTLAEVTEAVRQLVKDAHKNPQGSIPINNGSMGGDPAYGRQKQLTVLYAIDGGLPQTKIGTEGSTIELGTGTHFSGLLAGSTL